MNMSPLAAVSSSGLSGWKESECTVRLAGSISPSPPPPPAIIGSGSGLGAGPGSAWRPGFPWWSSLDSCEREEEMNERKTNRFRPLLLEAVLPCRKGYCPSVILIKGFLNVKQGEMIFRDLSLTRFPSTRSQT